VRELAEFAGADPLIIVDGIEQAMTQDGLVERTRRLRRARELAPLQIIDYEPAHAGAFRRLNEEWLRKYFTIEPVDEETFARCGDIVSGGGAILFARLDGELVGTCALIRETADRFELSKMAVTERYRGLHIGKRLMEAALDRARELGGRTVFLMTSSRLDAAVSLYRRTGFRITHSGPHAKYARSDLVMEMDLADHSRV
jgi:ribosomal protein S18 acetylase RimI-like enzyme